MSNNMKRIFSGIQPTGNLHIGNYIGALKQWVETQDQSDNIFCIVDLHAITVPQDPKVLRQKIRELAGIYLAAGISQEKSTIFVQSDVSAHAELGWILNCFTPLGWLSRMTQFKEKSEDKKDSVSTGLYDYPVLMAADILLYDTDQVPVGEDQKQHVELTRDIAQKFNNQFGETFKMPEPIIPKSGARIMSLVDPSKKMSKSDTNASGAIGLLDDPAEARVKIMKATTDSQTTIVFDQSRPGIYNLLTIYENLTNKSRSEIEQQFEGKNYGEFKTELANVVVEFLTEFQSKYNKFLNDPAELDRILKTGADKVQKQADNKVREVKSKVGLGV